MVLLFKQFRRSYLGKERQAFIAQASPIKGQWRVEYGMAVDEQYRLEFVSHWAYRMERHTQREAKFKSILLAIDCQLPRARLFRAAHLKTWYHVNGRLCGKLRRSTWMGISRPESGPLLEGDGPILACFQCDCSFGLYIFGFEAQGETQASF